MSETVAGPGVTGRRVVVTGASSESGVAVCAALVEAGAEVVAVGSNPAKISAVADRVPGIRTEVADLSDPAAVTALTDRLGAPVDGLIHLVGGWVGGAGIAGQSDEGWAAMERSFRTLRNVLRSFYPALAESPAGRTAFVSSVSVDAPTASGADYTAAKAASESWMRSVAQGFAKNAPDAAAVIFAVRSLVDERMRAASPEKTFAGATDVGTLAEAVVELWNGTAGELNGRRLVLQ
ncbi:SDR family oxidoreductase [Herbiconiux sp. VKM Ac-2851]|uniref:SDR family NAD(P)-dependent oxidoreductase n=1 Tax=Herbiconiux sp. VKM Ac-2851 TaxID=2739025 RepID=UPI001564F3BE|nr:SDR family NAD(P)-dependent oxidoreductase [Herbiconiux sp. VKM Ac-2851]NQX34933.1 SDR family NAD(P)-dependent oxidoreductase [Herbiconiux sp. VKM Ac-2851]